MPDGTADSRPAAPHALWLSPGGGRGACADVLRSTLVCQSRMTSQIDFFSRSQTLTLLAFQYTSQIEIIHGRAHVYTACGAPCCARHARSVCRSWRAPEMPCALSHGTTRAEQTGASPRHYAPAPLARSERGPSAAKTRGEGRRARARAPVVPTRRSDRRTTVASHNMCNGRFTKAHVNAARAAACRAFVTRRGQLHTPGPPTSVPTFLPTARSGATFQTRGTIK